MWRLWSCRDCRYDYSRHYDSFFEGDTMFQVYLRRRLVPPVIALFLIAFSVVVNAQTPRERNECIPTVKDLPTDAKEVNIRLPIPHNDPSQVISDPKISNSNPDLAMEVKALKRR